MNTKAETNKNQTENQERIIDASGRSFGRIATEAANALRGKDSPSFEKNRIMGQPVNIINASQISVSTSAKFLNKVYVRYSGYPGGKKEESLKKIIERKGYSEALRRSIYGMLPNNKLRPRLMKRLKISE
ncbi:MAG: 50S ribosomal protein L13 [Candidatus Paceibacterota bacterium]